MPGPGGLPSSGIPGVNLPGTSIPNAGSSALTGGDSSQMIFNRADDS